MNNDNYDENNNNNNKKIKQAVESKLAKNSF